MAERAPRHLGGNATADATADATAAPSGFDHGFESSWQPSEYVLAQSGLLQWGHAFIWGASIVTGFILFDVTPNTAAEVRVTAIALHPSPPKPLADPPHATPCSPVLHHRCSSPPSPSGSDSR